MAKISNKLKRGEVYAKWLAEKKKLKKVVRDAKRSEGGRKGGGEESEGATAKNVPKTLENTREIEDTLVDPDDPEVKGDEMDDEFR